MMRMVQVSLVVFATGGAFLGLLHYDLPYYLAAIVVLTELAVATMRVDVSQKLMVSGSVTSGARNV